VFEFLLSEEKKMRRHAANWLEVAERVFHYRRDQLTDAQRQQLHGVTGELKLRLKEKADTAKLKLGIEKLEDVLGKTGGRQYPANSMVENVEFFLVAAIVILGLRAYFVQPFKIPTNSMWPTYFGMTHELFKSSEEPGQLAKVARLVTKGAINYSAIASAEGEVLVPAANYGGGMHVIGSEIAGHTFAVIPSQRREFLFSVAGEYAKVNVPVDFDFERVLEEKYAGPGGDLSGYLRQQAMKAGDKLESSVMTVTYGGRRQEVRVYWVPVGQHVAKGDKIVSFDILTGDLLFVDRISYNFFQPKVGQGFVFKTENIQSPEMRDASGNQIRQYYIKRLVGTPGDTLEVKAPVLYRNGSPIDGSAAFGRNARKEGKYPGYNNVGELSFGQTVSVPEHNYFAMGDNSPRSKDSRYWGFVPEKDVVGKPLFIYYPLTTRWGPAQ